MIWKGNELKTIDDLMKLGIDKCDFSVENILMLHTIQYEDMQHLPTTAI